jgi:heme-degrading monooxygenase HmoA
MVVREWHAIASLAGAHQYADYVRTELLPAVTVLPGFVDLVLLRNDRDDWTADLVVLSTWESIEAMRRFAGDDVTRAVVEPHAAKLLTTFDQSVSLFEVVVTSRESGTAGR